MESLRSYTQHRHFPVHLMEFPGSWERSGNTEKQVFRLVPSLRAALVLEPCLTAVVGSREVGSDGPWATRFQPLVAAASLGHAGAVVVFWSSVKVTAGGVGLRKIR